MPQTPTRRRKTKKNRFYVDDVNDDEESGDQKLPPLPTSEKDFDNAQEPISLSLIFRKEETKTKSLAALSDFSVQNRFLCCSKVKNCNASYAS